MNPSAGGITYRRLRAPADHGQTLVDPPLTQAAECLEQNRARARREEAVIAGQTWSRLRQLAREGLRDALRQQGEFASDDPLGERPLVLGGHQPELFHPGVWFKNFVLSQLADSCQAVAVNLVVDNDLFRSAAIRCPCPTGRSRHGEHNERGEHDRPVEDDGRGEDLRLDDEVRIESVPFDRPADPQPYETRPALDPDLLKSFPERLQERVRGQVRDPIVTAIWPAVLDGVQAGRPLGIALAAARHQYERQRLGLQTYEVPLSAVCRTAAFGWLAADLLFEADNFRAVHNQALAEYRQVHRIRSQAHPAPPLRTQHDWIEAPFWIWSGQAPERRALFVRTAGSQLEIGDGQTGWIRAHASPEALAEALESASRQGIQVRPRALITTLFARLLLSDLFVHGIGGGKYDQLTDELIRRRYGIQPPGFLVATATVRWQQNDLAATAAGLAKRNHDLRAIEWHPENHIKPTAEVAEWIAEKSRLVRESPPRGQGKARHDRLTALNVRLREHARPLKARLAAERDELQARLRRQKILSSREFSFCLYSEQTLPPLLLDLARQST